MERAIKIIDIYGIDQNGEIFDNTYILLSSGNVLGKGSNRYGQLNKNTWIYQSIDTFSILDGLHNIIDINYHEQTLLCIDISGNIHIIGKDKDIYKQRLSKIKDISSASFYINGIVILKKDGSIYDITKTNKI